MAVFAKLYVLFHIFPFFLLSTSSAMFSLSAGVFPILSSTVAVCRRPKDRDAARILHFYRRRGVMFSDLHVRVLNLEPLIIQWTKAIGKVVWYGLSGARKIQESGFILECGCLNKHILGSRIIFCSRVKHKDPLHIRTSIFVFFKIHETLKYKVV